MERIVCNTKKEGEIVKILSPLVGLFSIEIENGEFLSSGNYIGSILYHNIRKKLFLPQDVNGRVFVEDKSKREIKVDYGQTLLTLSTKTQKDENGSISKLRTETRVSGKELIIESFITGIFYRSETPDAAHQLLHLGNNPLIPDPTITSANDARSNRS